MSTSKDMVRSVLRKICLAATKQPMLDNCQIASNTLNRVERQT